MMRILLNRPSAGTRGTGRLRMLRNVRGIGSHELAVDDDGFQGRHCGSSAKAKCLSDEVLVLCECQRGLLKANTTLILYHHRYRRILNQPTAEGFQLYDDAASVNHLSFPLGFDIAFGFFPLCSLLADQCRRRRKLTLADTGADGIKLDRSRDLSPSY